MGKLEMNNQNVLSKQLYMGVRKFIIRAAEMIISPSPPHTVSCWTE